MAALFALGVMSLTWMIAVAGLIAVEKLLPWRALANRLVALTLVVLALGVSLAPDQLPGLTLPGSASADKAMSEMSGNHGAMPAHEGTPMK
jgi:predicted metal-binding membrane protein